MTIHGPGKAKLTELLERVKAADGRDREIDGLIAEVAGWTHQKMVGDAQAYWRKPGETLGYMRSDLPAFTTSIDAALALVERMLPGWWWLREDGLSIRLVGPDNGDCYPSAVGRHHLVPLAILAALLSALSQIDNTGGEP